VVVHRGVYHDSVTLMLATRSAEAIDGISFAAAVMATPMNLALLEDEGFRVDSDVGPDDLVVALRAGNAGAAGRAERAVSESLAPAPLGPDPSSGTRRARSFRGAARTSSELNLALVSVPGRFAAYEAASALEAGFNVFCFSQGIDLEHEAELKRRALERGLLFLGPDCGTAIVGGVGLGFSNVIERGPVGIVGASGTGIQQVCCLLDAVGIGVSQAIGVGGRDLHETVGAAMTMRALELLAARDDTQVIAVVSKPADGAVADRVAEAAAAVSKPVIVGLLGSTEQVARGVETAASLEGTAARCARMLGRRGPELEDVDPPETRTPGELHGFFCGGSLRDEALSVVERAGARANFIDFGDEQYTQGRAHPMIDPSLRNQRFARDSRLPAVGAIVLDVVLGRGAHPDPARELAPGIESAVAARAGELTVVVALCGSRADPQDIERQERKLSAAGAVVTRNAAHAGRLALAATEAG
jgi:FdrA protein